jgi:endonuclease YncB( thermonuclease family)
VREHRPPAVGDIATARAPIGAAIALIALLTGAALNAALSGPVAVEVASSQARVVSIVDGDTLRVETLAGRDLGRVRLLGVDAPDVAHSAEPADCYADAATNQLERLAPIGSTVDLTPDTAQGDRNQYGRLLRCATSTTTAATSPASSSSPAPPAPTPPTRGWPEKRHTRQRPSPPRRASADCGATADRG